MASSIDDTNSAAALIRRLRKEQGLSQAQLAAHAGLSFSFVNQVEGGKKTLRLDALNQLLKVFGYTMAPTKITLPVFHYSMPEVEESSNAQSSFEPDPAPIRKKNDWAFFR